MLRWALLLMVTASLGVYMLRQAATTPSVGMVERLEQRVLQRVAQRSGLPRQPPAQPLTERETEDAEVERDMDLTLNAELDAAQLRQIDRRGGSLPPSAAAHAGDEEPDHYAEDTVEEVWDTVLKGEKERERERGGRTQPACVLTSFLVADGGWCNHARRGGGGAAGHATRGGRGNKGRCGGRR
jgi:hypothetical protein